jgi:hypothetical protein
MTKKQCQPIWPAGNGFRHAKAPFVLKGLIPDDEASLRFIPAIIFGLVISPVQLKTCKGEF